MPMYINGRPVNPVVSILISAIVIAGLIGLGILLLPIIGSILLFILVCVAALAIYGVYYRWRYGDPLAKMQQEVARHMQRRAQGASAQAAPQDIDEPVKKGLVRTGIRRTTTVEDVEVVEEIRHRDPQ